MVSRSKNKKQFICIDEFGEMPRMKISPDGATIEHYITKESDIKALRQQKNILVCENEELKSAHNEQQREIQTLTATIGSMNTVIHNLRTEIRTRNIETRNGSRHSIFERDSKRRMMTHIIAESLVPNSEQTVHADDVFKMVDVAKRVVDEIERRTQ